MSRLSCKDFSLSIYSRKVDKWDKFSDLILSSSESTAKWASKRSVVERFGISSAFVLKVKY